MKSLSRQKASTSVVLLIAAGTLLAACSSSTTTGEVDAEGPTPSAAHASVNSQITDSVTQRNSPSRAAGNLGTRVCVINNTELTPTVSFTKKDTSQDGAIPPRGTKCGEGTFGAGKDVIGNISWGKQNWVTAFSATNPWMGAPGVYVSESDPAGKELCSRLNSFDVNESTAGDNGIVSVTLTRLPDDQWKEFELTFSPSKKPSTDGQRTAMQGFVSCTEYRAMTK